MSERSGGGFGAFLLGVAVGAVVAFLFAPETGDVTRAKLRKKLRGLKDLAEEKAGELAEAVAGSDEEEEEAARLSPREELERRLADARRRRRTGRGKVARAALEAVEEEDEPVA